MREKSMHPVIFHERSGNQARCTPFIHERPDFLLCELPHDYHSEEERVTMAEH